MKQPIVIRTEVSRYPRTHIVFLSARDHAPADIHPTLRIATLTNENDRPVTVYHGDREDRFVDLEVGGSTEHFLGMRFGGFWGILAELLEGEKIGDPEHAPPDRLRLSVELVSAKGLEECGRERK